jgi:S-adenosylmethionine decarboxylase
MTAIYRPGLHVLGEIRTDNQRKLEDEQGFLTLCKELIGTFGLTDLGTVAHRFPGAGFTVVVCFTESHLSIHTWPEFGYLTFDVYLSNFTKINDDTVNAIFEEVLKYFEAKDVSRHEIRR